MHGRHTNMKHVGLPSSAHPTPPMLRWRFSVYTKLCLMNSASSPSPNANPITLPFTPDAAVQVLEWGANPERSPHSHKQIAEWCDRFWCQYIDVDAPPPEIERLLPILTDVETQWDLYLANTYRVEELRSRSFEDKCLPVRWFQNWLSKARA